MRKITLICIWAGLTVLLSGCLLVSFDGIGANAVQGTGNMVTKDFDTWDFTGIDIGGNYVIVYRQSQTVSISVSMQENLFDYLNVGVRNGILHVDSDRSFRTDQNYRPRIYISAPYLETVIISGAASIENWDTIAVETLHINVSGAGDGLIPMHVDTLEISIAGAADFTLTGTASTANLSIAGAGDIDALGLQAVNATVVIAGAGSADVAVSDTLDVTITGAGTVRYVGSPQVNRTIAGIGSVQRVE